MEKLYVVEYNIHIKNVINVEKQKIIIQVGIENYL
jgi:hypothetical protein